MSNGSQEQERLRRLRERQLADRNPNVKQQQFQRLTSQRERKRDKSYSLGRMWSDIPHVWRYSFYGLLLGVLVLLVLPLFWSSSWVLPCSIAAILVLTIFGGVVGNAVDSREEIKDLMR